MVKLEEYQSVQDFGQDLGGRMRGGEITLLTIL